VQCEGQSFMIREKKKEWRKGRNRGERRHRDLEEGKEPERREGGKNKGWVKEIISNISSGSGTACCKQGMVRGSQKKRSLLGGFRENKREKTGGGGKVHLRENEETTEESGGIR